MKKKMADEVLCQIYKIDFEKKSTEAKNRKYTLRAIDWSEIEVTTERAFGV